MDYPSLANSFLAPHVKILCRSYRKLIGSALITVPDASYPAIAEALYNAPFAVVSHDTSQDPLFNYANLKALDLFGFTWAEFTALPSRLSAEQALQEERDKLLAEVNLNGFIRHYSGVRISKTGRRFLIKNAVVWNLYDHHSVYAGQAACFADWCNLD
ncbi:MAG: MEKHLA domain-containing protein [Gammaproteobacteria bacterium]|nr:MEKHLA domain-containing protein [Gammaproteobacteria bacterium]